MIIADQKPLTDIKGFIGGCNKVLIAGCGTCVTVCLAGGETEVKNVASALRIAFKGEGSNVEILEDTVERQCDNEFVEPLLARVKNENIDAVVTLACGVGCNFLSTRIGPVPVYPGVNTSFLGSNEAQGDYLELCAGCGDCILHLTGGVCPMARCSKQIMNGPCGGTSDGKCEISQDVDCGWYLIVKRLQELGKLEQYERIQAARDWTKGQAGGPRRLTKETASLKAEEDAAKEK
ncbi:MAG: methylenetetrahydrofolate reductase C-terminal domain-containing protein [Planctomycetota bacterium]|jgi:ferredoxin